MRAKFAAMTQEMPLALMVDVLHAVGGDLLVALGVQIARGDDDVRIDVIPILMDNAVCIHLFMTSSG